MGTGEIFCNCNYCFKHCGALPGDATEDEWDQFADIAADTAVLGEFVS